MLALWTDDDLKSHSGKLIGSERVKILVTFAGALFGQQDD
jgi:hypothetical protein